MKQNKQYEYNLSIEWTLALIMIVMLITFILTITNDKDISRLEKSDKCFENLLVKNYDINYEMEERSNFLENCMNE